MGDYQRTSLPILLGVHSLRAGGTERVVSVLAQEFATRADLEVHVLMYGRTPELFFELPPGVIVHTPSFCFDSHSRLVAIIKTLWFIRKTIQKVKPGFVLNFGEYWNNLVLVATRRLDVPVFVADRSSPDKHLGPLHEPLRRFLYRRAEGVFAQTENAAVRLRGILPPKTPIHVVANPLSTLPNPTYDGREMEVLFVGRLIPSKNVDRLIRMFCRVRATGWSLRIVGGDAQGYCELKKLQQLVEELDAKDCVHIMGELSEVADFYQQASIFAFPSSSEGFPNSLAEALSFGLPCVAYDCSAGPSDLIQSGVNGFLVPVFDDSKFAQYLVQLMESDSLRIRMSAMAVASVNRLARNHIADEFLRVCLGAGESNINHLRKG